MAVTITNISVNELPGIERQYGDGLIIQDCDLNPYEAANVVNETFTHGGILLERTEFQKCYGLRHSTFYIVSFWTLRNRKIINRGYSVCLIVLSGGHSADRVYLFRERYIPVPIFSPGLMPGIVLTDSTRPWLLNYNIYNTI